MQEFTIKQCSDPLLWYRNSIGKRYYCLREEKLTGGIIYWTHEDCDYGRFLNWVWKHDTEGLSNV